MSQNPQEQQEQQQEQVQQLQEQQSMEEEDSTDELIQYEEQLKEFVNKFVSLGTLPQLSNAMIFLENKKGTLKVVLKETLRSKFDNQQEKENKINVVLQKIKFIDVQIRRVTIMYNDFIDRQDLPSIEFNLPTEIEMFVHALEGTRFEPVGMSRKIDEDGCYILAVKWKLPSN